MAPAIRRKRWWRWPLYLVLSLAVLLALLFVALRTSFAREQVRAQVNSALAQLFRGRVELQRIGSLTLWGVGGVDARIFDESGKQVIAVHGLSATASLAGLGWQLVTHADAPELYIASVHVDYADVTLREDEELGVTLASTFLPRSESESAPPQEPDAGPRLHIGQVTFDNVWAHGHASGSPALDANLRQLVGSLWQSPVDGFRLELERVALSTRNLPLAVDPRGHVTGIVEAPANDAGPLRLELTLDGQAATSPVALEISWVGDDLHSTVRAWRVPAAFINQHAPGLALDGEVAVIAEVDGPLPQLDFNLELASTAAQVKATGYAVVSGGLELAASIAATGVNLARVAADAPESDLELRANAFLIEQDDGQFVGSHRLDVAAGALAGQRTPALWLTGRDELGSDDGLASVGKLGANEDSASLVGSYRVALPRNREGSITTTLTAAFDQPARLKALGVRACGTATLSAELRPEQGQLSGKAALALSYLEYQALRAQNLQLRAQASGSLADPQLEAGLEMELLSGSARAQLDYSSTAQKLDVFASKLQLLPLLRSLQMPLPLEQAEVTLEAHIEGSGRSPRYRLALSSYADLGKLGAVKLTATDFELPASAPTLAELGRLRGDVRASGALDLEAVSPLLTAANVPIERTTGRVRFEAAARHRRDDAQGLELSLQIDTNGLRIVQERKTKGELATTNDAIASKPLALEGIDLRLSTRVWPQSGSAVGTLILRDAGGTLGDVQAEAQLAGLSLGQLANVERLAHVPLKMTLEVPERRLQRLPALLRVPALRGRGSLEASLEGSLAEPEVKGRVVLSSLRASGAPGAPRPIDVVAELTGGSTGGAVKADAKLTTSGAQLLELAAEWRGDLLRDGPAALTGSADVELTEFPLDVVPQIVDRQVGGRVSGVFKLSDWGRDARLDANLRSTTLSFAQMPVQDLTVSARSGADRIVAELGMKVGAGTAKATLDAELRWGRRPLPELGHRGNAKLTARALRLEPLAPILAAYVSEIGGVLDANTELAVTSTTTTLSGTAQLSGGVVQLPALGQRFSDINARVGVANNQFRIEKLEARGTTGRVTVRGGAELDGFALREAKAQIAIAERESLPITLEGEAIGDAWGHVNATFENPARGARKLDIEVPDFHLTTPETGGHGLQSLENDDDIEIGTRRADGRFVVVPVQPLKPGGKPETASGEPAPPLQIRVKLGNNVVVQRGRTALAQLTGQLQISSGTETEVSGRIELRGGKLDVSGKTFEIERGVITFEGNDPANPTITATARWDAPGYTVYAEYIGDVQNGRIKLRAEPPLTQDEIASLLLFGSPDGSAAGGGSDTASLAVGVAGDTATQGLNQVLDDFTNLDVSARVDTTTGSARPELVFQVSRRVSAKVTRAVGAPAAGESPDRTFLTLELRLKRAWALSAIFGDHGASALDLIWRRRY